NPPPNLHRTRFLFALESGKLERNLRYGDFRFRFGFEEGRVTNWGIWRGEIDYDGMIKGVIQLQDTDRPLAFLNQKSTMDEHQKSLILSSSSHFPPPQGIPFFFLISNTSLSLFLLFTISVKLSYGTAGFRADASILHSTVFRVGILAALRSLKTQSVIGLMITASHNQVSDNGIKIADPSGGMLTQEWEPFADSIANAPTPQDLLQLVEEGFTLMDPGMWRYSWEETPGPVANLFSKLQNK
ncbi:Phosphoacetylglucosamine mutase, partial [Linum perenne]